MTAERFADLLCDLAFEALSLLDASGVVRATSDKDSALVGGQPGQTPSAGTFAQAHPEDLAEAERVWQRMMASPGEAIRSCLRMKHADGGWRWIEASGRNLLGDPDVKLVVFNWRDVTEVRKTEQALRASEGRYRLIAENAHDLILRIAPNGALTYVSPASMAILGRSSEELVGTDFFGLVHPEDLPGVRQSHGRATQTLSAMPGYRVRRRDGAWSALEANARLLPDSPEGDLLVVARDITNKGKIDEQFLQAQKMDAVGRLAGGVAHDFNNLLSIITSAGTLLHDELPADHPSQAMTEEIRIACRRAADLTRQLLAFSRRQMLVAAPVSVNDLVKAAFTEVKGQLGGEIKVVFQLDPNVGVIQADASQIERVLVNLTLNARDAMPNGGVLTYSTANTSIAPSDLDTSIDTSIGEYVRVRVEDTGIGMNAVTRSHLFEPFFTTKPRGKGVGLGLATAYGVIRQSNGHIRVRSELGEGAAFSLMFPRSGARMPVAAAAAPAAPSAAIPVGTETILLVEDDSAVRRVAAALLTKKGYRVIQAEGGKEALAITDAVMDTVQLLLTDVMMPGMTGPEIATALTARKPGLRVLFMSGYNNESVHNILHKPFTLDTLSRRVREMLDAPAA